MMTRIPAAIPIPPRTELPSANAHAAQPNDSVVSSVTKIRWKAFSDISVRLGSGRKIVQRPHRQSHQAGEKEHGESERGVDRLFLGQQMHEKTGDDKGIDTGDGEDHG